MPFKEADIEPAISLQTHEAARQRAVRNGERQMGGDVSYSVVIPVFNGEQSVGELAVRLGRVFETMGKDFEILFVDDHSADGSWRELKNLAARDGRMKALRLARNFGQHNATLAGLSYAAGQLIITMDDDLQHAPEDIPLLIREKEATGAQVVIARLFEKKHPWHRRLASDLIRKFNELLIRKPRGLYLSSFRLLEGSVAERMLARPAPFPFIPALLFQSARLVVNADVRHNRRKYGHSNYNLKRMCALAARLFINSLPVLRHWPGPGEPAWVVAEAVNVKVQTAAHFEGGNVLATAGLGPRGRTAAGSFDQKG